MTSNAVSSDGGQRGADLWRRGHEPSHAMASLASALALTAVVIDVLISGHIGLFFDLSFVAICLAVALLVRPGDFVVTALVPPSVMVGIFVILGLTAPAAAARADDNLAQVVVSGLSHHSVALFVGYALCLACLGYRHRLLPEHAG